MTDTSTSADFSGGSERAGSPAEGTTSPADSYDEGDADYGSMPDYGADGRSEDPELGYDELPDYSEDQGAEAQEWKEGQTVQLHDARTPEGNAATNQDGHSQRSEQPREVHTPSEQSVVDVAKADLKAREQVGEILGGDPVNRVDQWHRQGQNERGYQQTCALAATSEVLRDCGVELSESEIVDQAVIAQLCETGQPTDAANGSVQDGYDISLLLTVNGVENRLENPQGVVELANYVEQGRGVIAEVSSEELPGTTDASPGYYNIDGRASVDHAVQVTGTVRDSSGELTGFVINDTGQQDGAGHVVPITTWDACWTNADKDRETVVTNHSTYNERAGR